MTDVQTENVQKDIKTAIKQADKRLAGLQQDLKRLKIPAVILFEGWGASGKGAIIGKLISELDPRAFKVYTIGAPSADEARRPMMWRFWSKTPEYGKISVFDRSWYRDVTIARVEDNLPKSEINLRFREIRDFETQLSDDGCLIIKFFLRLSKSEQKKRFKKLESDAATSWRVTSADWKHHRDYDEYLHAFEDMIKRTDRPCAPWLTVDADDKDGAVLSVLENVAGIFSLAVSEAEERGASGALVEEAELAAGGAEKGNNADFARDAITVIPLPPLSAVSLDASVDGETYKSEVKKAHVRLFELHNRLYRTRTPLVVVYEGWDAAGKGGNIKRLTQGLDPRGCEVIPVAAPSPRDASHHYLWRFWDTLPKDGHIAIYDRSWYGRVMVERIEGFCSEEQWRRAYGEINRFERSLAAWGAVVIKFWLHIDRDEQLRRFEERMISPEKNWKITDEDWRNREKWDEYETCVNDMLRLTNTEYAPWVVVESNDKKYARLKVMREVIARLERHFEV